MVLRNGCVCCSVRSELRDGLRELIDGRAQGEVPPFDRIVIETTGLADPVPVVQTMIADPMLRNHVRLAEPGFDRRCFERHRTDRHATRGDASGRHGRSLVITKTDLSNGRQIEKLQQRLMTINPMAPISRSPGNVHLWKQILGNDPSDPQSRTADASIVSHAAETLQCDAWSKSQTHGKSHHPHSIVSFALRISKPIDWSPFVVWLSLLVHRHGRDVLRIKGLLDVPEAKGPIVLNAVQHFIHPPVHLDGWPDDDHTSRLVFIVQGLEEAAIRISLANFLRRASPNMQHRAEAM